MTVFCTVGIYTRVRKHTKDLTCRKEDRLEIIRMQDTNAEICVTRSLASRTEIGGLKPSEFDVLCLVQ